MTITVFGATSPLGLEIIKQALSRDFIVKAFGRNVASLIDKDLHTKNFEAIKGYVFDEKDVSNALENTDVVISCLGGGVDGTDKTRSLGTKNIINQMHKKSVRRIITVADACILDSANGKLIFESDDYPEELKVIALEHYNVLIQLKESYLDWTIFCPQKITALSNITTYRFIENTLPENSTNKISTANLSDCILSITSNSKFTNTRIGICNN